MSKETLKEQIDLNIKTNGLQQITGEKLNNVLNDIVDEMALGGGVIEEGNTQAVSGGEVYDAINGITTIMPINLSTPSPEQNGIFQPTEVGVYGNFGGLEITTEELENNIVYFYYLDGIFTKQIKEVLTVDEVTPEGLNAVNGKAVFEYTNQTINTIADLRLFNGKEGQIITLLGYYEAGDKKPLNYKWTSEQGIDDGGAVINTDSGSWEAVLENRIITNKDFGAKCNGIDNDHPYTQKMADFINNINNKCLIESNTYLTDYVHFSNKSNIEVTIGKIVFKSYECIRFTNCKNSVLKNGLIDGKSDTSVVGVRIIDSQYFNIENLEVINIGNSSLNEVRGVAFQGDCSYSNIYNLKINNIVSSSVASGLSIIQTTDDNILKSSKYITIDNLHVKNVYPPNDADGFKILQLLEDNYLYLSNSTFENCSKRAIKLQGRYNYIKNVNINGECMFAGVDAQSGYTDIDNLNVNVTTLCESLVSFNFLQCTLRNSTLNGNESLTQTNIQRGVKLYKGNSLVTEIGRDILIENVHISNVGIPVHLYNFDKNDMNISITRVSASNFNYPYMTVVDVKGKSLTVNKISRVSSIGNFYGLLKFENISTFDILDLDTDKDLLLTPNLLTTTTYAKKINYGFIHVNIPKAIQTGTTLVLWSAYSPLGTVNSNLSSIIRYAVKGWEIINTNFDSDIEKYVCTGNADGTTDNLGTWRVVYKMTKSNNVTDVTASNATDLDTALTLVNELKAKLNAKLQADRNSGQQAT